MAMTAEAIIFAINSAIRLGRNAQRAYAKSLTSKSIVLPLPAFSGEANGFVAQRFFDDTDEQTGGHQYLAQLERLADIHERFKHGEGDQFPTEEEVDLYVAYFKQLRSLLEQEAAVDFQQGLKDDRINADELVALLSIRQYTFDPDKHSSPLQMVAGTLVEIGIDYFNRVPGALNEQSATGRTLKHFLKALDGLQFSNQAAFRQQTRKIVPELFIAAAETLQELSSDLTHDPKVQRFVQAAGKGIATDLYERLSGMDQDRQDEAVQWGRFLLRTTIANAGEYVLQTPNEVFHTEAGATALIQATGSVLLDAILQDPHQLKLKEGLNADTLDRLLQTTFRVMAEHPDIIHRKAVFQQVVSEVSSSLAAYSFRRPDLFPELARLVLGSTGKHLHLFWQKPGQAPPQVVQDTQSLFLRALQLILHEISQPVDDGAWRPHLSKGQLVFITETLLDEVVTNPAWVEHKMGDKPLLALVVRTTLDALAALPRDQRLGPDVLNYLLERNLRTIAANDRVLTPIRWSNDSEEKAVLQRVLDLVFSYVFQQDHSRGDRAVLLAEILDYALDTIISKHPDRRGLVLVDLILFEQEGLDYRAGFNRELANDLVDAALRVISAHPDLVSRDAALGAVVAGVAGALEVSDFKDPNLLPELLRLTLESTALNAELIIDAESDNPKFLLVQFIRELLLALSQDLDQDGGWQPNITPTEAMLIVDNLVNELIAHPEWIVAGPDGQIIFRDVLQAVRASLRAMPAGTKISTDHIEYLMALALQTAATSEAVLDAIPWGADIEKRTVLERALTMVSSFIFRELRVTGSEQILRFTDLLDYVLQVIITYHPDRKGLMLVQLILFGEDDIDYSRGFDEALATEIMESSLRVVERHPELIAQDNAVQAIVSQLAASLTANDLRRPGILPELVRMVLELSAINVQLIVPAAPGESRFLLVIALKSLLEQLSATDQAGKWSPQLGTDAFLGLTENLLDEVVQHPHWILPQPQQSATLWEEVIEGVFDALRLLPKGSRLAPDTLETLLMTSLYTAANSPSVLRRLRWGNEQQEKLILNKALELTVSYIYPPTSQASPQRLAIFQDLLDFVLDTVLSKYPDKRALILLDLLFFESAVDFSQGFSELLAEDLVDAGADILAAHPELVAREAVFQKILSDVGGALRASRRPLNHLLPEFVRLVLHYAAGHLESLMRISANSPRILLAVAIEQTLRVITQPPKRGRWSPSLTEEQVVETIEVVLERVIANPQWVDSNRLIQLTLEAIFSALGELKREQSIPYQTVQLLVAAGLEAVGHRRQLVMESIQPDGSRQQLVLEYALGGLFLKLYDEDGGTAGAWTLTQAEQLDVILTHFLARLAVGPTDQATIDKIHAPIFQAVDDINNNLAFTLDELIMAIEGA